MGDSQLTKTLKRAGMLFLKNNLCDLIAPEVKVRNRKLLESNHHHIIDLVGIGDKYTKDGKIRVSRGIEVKISRSDFKNGFIHSGCNYHYLLVSKGLVKKSEVSYYIGIIEYDEETFSVFKWRTKYLLTGFKVIRPPIFQKLSERDFNYVQGQMAYCASLGLLRTAREQLMDLK
jgi:hypothetical protein